MLIQFCLRRRDEDCLYILGTKCSLPNFLQKNGGIFESSVERVSLNLGKGFSYRKGKIQVCLTTRRSLLEFPTRVIRQIVSEFSTLYTLRARRISKTNFL